MTRVLLSRPGRGERQARGSVSETVVFETVRRRFLLSASLGRFPPSTCIITRLGITISPLAPRADL